MRKHTMRMLAGLLALALCITALTIQAFADPEETETSKPEIVTPVDEVPPVITTTEPNNTVALETEAPVREATTEPVTETTEPETTPVTEPTESVEAAESAEASEPEAPPRSRFRFTPDGQLTLIDDFEYVGMDADGNTLSKQFLTVETRDGHYFYIIIDRIGDTENVYFLNQVDAADLTAITQIEPTSSGGEYKTPTKIEPTPTKEADDPVPTEEPTEPKTETVEPAAQQSKLKAYLSLAAIVAIGAASGVYLIIRRKKASGQKQKLTEYDLDEDEELEIEPEDGEEEPDEQSKEEDPEEDDE